MLLMCTVLRLSSVRSWHTLKLLNMAGSKQSSCLEPQNRQLPLATDCRLLEVQQKTPDWPPALIMPYSCCYSRRKAQAGWVVGRRQKGWLLLAAAAVTVFSHLAEQRVLHPTALFPTIFLYQLHCFSLPPHCMSPLVPFHSGWCSVAPR